MRQITNNSSTRLDRRQVMQVTAAGALTAVLAS
jgi:hypothetical protein